MLKTKTYQIAAIAGTSIAAIPFAAVILVGLPVIGILWLKDKLALADLSADLRAYPANK
jgi:hypothetical protein